MVLMRTWNSIKNFFVILYLCFGSFHIWKRKYILETWKIIYSYSYLKNLNDLWNIVVLVNTSLTVYLVFKRRRERKFFICNKNPGNAIILLLSTCNVCKFSQNVNEYGMESVFNKLSVNKSTSNFFKRPTFGDSIRNRLPFKLSTRRFTHWNTYEKYLKNLISFSILYIQ